MIALTGYFRSLCIALKKVAYKRSKDNFYNISACSNDQKMDNPTLRLKLVNRDPLIKSAGHFCPHKKAGPKWNSAE
jgi:hypothetical protein